MLKIYAVYDKKAMVYAPPFFVNTAIEAVRAFGELVSDGRSTVAKYPSDFALYWLGDFDDCSGSFIPVPNGVPNLVHEAMEFVKGSPEADVTK